MSDLQAVIHLVEQLSPTEQIELRHYLEDKTRYQWQHRPEDAEKRIAALRTAVDDFWGDMSPADIDEVVEAMNAEYIEPEDSSLFAWLDALPEDEQ